MAIVDIRMRVAFMVFPRYISQVLERHENSFERLFVHANRFKTDPLPECSSWAMELLQLVERD